MHSKWRFDNVKWLADEDANDNGENEDDAVEQLPTSQLKLILLDSVLVSSRVPLVVPLLRK